MVFWPNLGQIGGYFFQKLAISSYQFLALFFGYKGQKHTKLNPLGAKRTKEIGKIGPEALLQIREPQTPQKPPLSKPLK